MSYIEKKPNVVDLCRLCLAKDETLIQVFDSVQIDQILCDKIKECLAIKISTQDRVSQKICGSCLIKVDTFYEFRSISLESQRVLQGWLLDLDNVAIDIHSKEPEIHTEKVIDVDYPLENSSEEEGFENESGSTDEGSSFGVSEERVAEQGVGQIQPDVTNILPITQSAGPSGLQPSEEVCSFTEICSVPSNCGNVEEGERNENGINLTKPGGGLFRYEMPKKYGCDLCGYSSKSSGNLKKHVMRHRNEYKIKCKTCGKGFYSNSRYREHTVDGVCQQSYLLKCSKCSKRYNSLSNLSEHMSSHEPGFIPSPSFQCDACGKLFQTRRGMMKHITVIHKGLRHKCMFCEKELTCAKSLEIHMKQHTGEKTVFNCQTCGKIYSTYKNLASHESTHTGEQPYSCDLCNQVFTQKSALVVHKRYHSGERPFKCSHCAKSFVSKSIMKSHEGTHKT